MSDIIKLLPDSVANQIAAGEVIQRPASVIKELVENAVDAGSSCITVHVKDSGRTLIQVIDNGSGMSPTDARLAFERHATSKISCAQDIFSIKTKGFRGEALASIAAVAQVEMRTRREADELGTIIVINGSTVEKQEPVQCAAGSNFMVKNLFYNIPVRREFLKTDNYEFGLIVEEFQRVSLAHPEVQFLLYHNDKEVFNLPKSNVLRRITYLFGKSLDKTLIPVEVRTNLVSVSGFVAKPETAKKRNSEQYFLVNNRFIRHKSFYAAVMRSYESLLPEKWQPQYFLFFDINPGEIDVNIHPTKTEVKFKNDTQITSILEAAVKEALGKFNVRPSIDFEDDQDYNDMFRRVDGSAQLPSFAVNAAFNPFASSPAPRGAGDKSAWKSGLNDNASSWESLYKGFESERQPPQPEQTSLDLGVESRVQESGSFMQFRSRYIITAVKSGLMVIDQRRAHERVLYERYQQQMRSESHGIQHMLHPHVFDVGPSDFGVISEALGDLRTLGFEIEEFGRNTFAIHGIPAEMKPAEIETRLNELLVSLRELRLDSKLEVKESLARTLAKINAVPPGMPLTHQQMQELVSDLFMCQSPNLSPEGKKVVYILENDEIALKFS